MASSSEIKLTKILFVCYGNTCRSPMAEAVFNHLAMSRNVHTKFQVDSAGLSSWQAGDDPNDFVKEILTGKNIPIAHKARTITTEDFKKFDYILGMDLYNMNELNRIAESLESESKIRLLGDFNPNKEDKIIVDPFFDLRKEDFEKCYSQINESCAVFLETLLEEAPIKKIDC